MDDLDKMLAQMVEEGAQNKAKQKAPAEKAYVPQTLMEEIDGQDADAVVMLEIHGVCKGCGTKYVYPNKRLMLRKGRNLLRAKKWIHSHGLLPREVHRHEEAIDRCGQCINEGSIYDIIEEQRRIADKRQ